MMPQEGHTIHPAPRHRAFAPEGRRRELADPLGFFASLVADFMPLPDLIESHAAKLRELHEAVWVTFRIRDEGDAQREAWSEACRRFHSSYDELAFPGGLSNAMSMLPAKNPTTI